MVDSKVILKFKKVANYPIDQFLIESKSFFEVDFPKMVDFFGGKADFLDKKHLKKLKDLLNESAKLENIFILRKKLMTTSDFWELLDLFEDVKTKLETANNISKYLRSSIIANKNKAGLVVDYTLASEQTLENVSRTFLNQNSFENDWTNIAIENNLKEVDYDIKGDTTVKVRRRVFQNDLVTSMIDNTIGEKIYGKDIYKVFTYEENDLKSLGYKETAFQSTDILAELEKGDIPEFPGIGLNMSFYKGINLSQLNYPSITRELKNNFSTDDLFKDFEIKSLKTMEDNILIEFKVSTKYELVLIKNVAI